MLVTPVNSVFSAFYKPEQNNQPKTLLHVALSGKSNKEKIVSSKNIFAILGSFAGAVIPMLFMRNKNEKFLKSLTTINYSCKNIILLANSALIGGYLGGLADHKGKKLEAKTKNFSINL
jgi:hypothetical protein